MESNKSVHIVDLRGQIASFWSLATDKAKMLYREYDQSQGSPVYTVDGRYTTKGWTEWTQGFMYGIPLLVFDVTGDEELLDIAKRQIMDKMSHHLTHIGVHDHGFNNLSTYGNLLRLSQLGKFAASEGEKACWRMALSVSGSVQASRWSEVKDGGYIYSFNGPHSMFIDTLRSCRILFVSDMLGHKSLGEHDEVINLCERAVTHALTSAKYSVFYGDGRDSYDVAGRVAHESIFNMNDGLYRCPNSQQGFSGFTTWTRGLAWAMAGFTEIVELLDDKYPKLADMESVRERLLRAARVTCDFYIDHSTKDGVVYWDTGAPELHKLGNYREQKGDPYNDYEPIDSSASAIAVQGLLRLGNIYKGVDNELSKRYTGVALNTLSTLLSDNYLAVNPSHQGILRHSVYHQPNGWDNIPAGCKVPADESSMWGDYAIVEAALLAQRILDGGYYKFYETL